MAKVIEECEQEFIHISEIVEYLIAQGHPLARWLSAWQEDNYQSIKVISE